MAKDRKNFLIIFLIVIILLMGLVMSYFFLVQPRINNYTINAQNQGAEFIIVSIMQRAATCQPVPLTYQDQTINLIAIECLQAPQGGQQTAPSEPVEQ